MNVFQKIPAPGYSLISGKRKPPASMGTHLYVQIRAGYVCEEPWPVATTIWIWGDEPHEGDVVAVRRVV
jgi:hypothetical protein